MKRWKSEKGSITLFTLVAMVFISMYLVLLYLDNSNTEATQIEQAQRIKEIYEKDIDKVDSIYDKLVDTTNYMNPYLPEGYYYVGGNWDTGYVISSSSLDGNKGDSYETAQQLVGNQFVWVPVDETQVIIQRDSKIGQQIQNYTEEASDLQEFLESVKKYGGFYIGRYETGKQTKEDGSNIAVIQANQEIWTQISQTEAIQVANQFNIRKTKMNTTILNSYAWDMTCSWLQSQGIDVTDSSLWGNHINNTLKTNTVSRSAQNASWSACNLYDFAGNAGEWTTEVGTQPVFRGGSYATKGNQRSVHYREEYLDEPDGLIGFRILLYQK